MRLERQDFDSTCRSWLIIAVISFTSGMVSLWYKLPYMAFAMLCINVPVQYFNVLIRWRMNYRRRTGKRVDA